MPAGAWVAYAFGWRTVMTGIGVLASVGAALVWWRLPGRLFVGRIDAAAWRAIAAHPTLLRVVGVTAIHASAQFVLFSYVVIAYRDTLRASPATVTPRTGGAPSRWRRGAMPIARGGSSTRPA